MKVYHIQKPWQGKEFYILNTKDPKQGQWVSPVDNQGLGFNTEKEAQKVAADHGLVCGIDVLVKLWDYPRPELENDHE